MDIKKIINKYLNKPEPIPTGIYHYQSPPEDPRNYRYHLRTNPDGTGLFIVNASTILHLNQTASEYAYHMINKSDKHNVIKSISSRYKVSADQIQEDYTNFIENIEGLLFTPDLDPILFWGMDLFSPNTSQLDSPLRLDCALTYHTSNQPNPGKNLSSRVDRELNSEEWSKIINAAWEFGIPHIIFTGGEPTLRQDLANLIQVAEDNGQITGLITDGYKFQEKSYLHSLLNTGLDHIMIVWHNEHDSMWASLNNIIDEDIFVTVHITINQAIESKIFPLLSKLSKLGIKSISLSAESPNFHPQLLSASDQVADQQMQLVWDLPVPFFNENPIWTEEKIHGGKFNAIYSYLYVEPDGDVLISQDSSIVLGNLLKDKIDTIWLAHSDTREE